MKLNAIKFGLAAGITASVIMLISTIAFRLFWMHRMPAAAPGTEQMMMQMQQYMTPAWGAMIVNTLWIFVTYLVIGTCFAWVYNKLL